MAVTLPFGCVACRSAIGDDTDTEVGLASG